MTAASGASFVLVDLGFLLQPRQHLLHCLQVCQDQLGLDGLDVAGRIDRTIDVSHIRVVEHSRNLADRIRLADVGQKGVSHSLALAGTPNDSGYVDEAHRCRHGTGGMEELGQDCQPRVRYAYNSDVGIDRGKWVAGSQYVIAGEGVEQS